ncbi:hypothetical protein Pint_25637 [Pistacia integerrima]|uniref:Uncharacterized protein n=1 Tax=Pistacia integerrima TaxID=434235 RepID=A0ACC0YFM3_9ROSI|nr:hypothetical protein Pint_25637 [Pistacia integerrima]
MAVVRLRILACSHCPKATRDCVQPPMVVVLLALGHVFKCMAGQGHFGLCPRACPYAMHKCGRHCPMPCAPYTWPTLDKPGLRIHHELIDLIDRDCADFVNLNTKLVDVDAAIVRMQAPLLELRERIEGFRVTIKGSILALQSGLKKRLEAAAAREAFELLLDTFHVVSKLISVLGVVLVGD